MGHLRSLHSISAERPVKIHFRSVSIERARTTRARCERKLQVCSTKRSFCTITMTARHTDSLFVKSNSEAPAQYDAYLGSAVVALLIADIEALSLIARQFRLNGNVGLGFLDCHLQKAPTRFAPSQLRIFQGAACRFLRGILALGQIAFEYLTRNQVTLSSG